MKSLFLVAILFLLSVMPVNADHLTCDPVSETIVTKYEIKLNGVELAAGLESAGDGLVRIYYNIDHLPPGDYVAVAAAGNNSGWSVWSSPPLEFTIEGYELPGEDVIINSGFEAGEDSWNFYTNGVGEFLVGATDSYEGLSSAKIAIDTVGTNVQLNQINVSLEANTDYRLTFAAKSNSGHDFKVSIFKDVKPYTNYGLPSTVVNVMTFWSEHVIEFTTPDLGAPVNDARLMFWFVNHAQTGDEYWLDNVVIEKVDAPSAPPDAPQNVFILQ